MFKFNGFLKVWFLALLLVTFTVGCSGSSDNAPPPKAFTAYSLDGVAGTVNEPAQTISVTMPYGTAVTALTAAFATTGTGVKVGAVVQTSAVTKNNFSAPVAYTVTASDNTAVTYSVTVTIAPNSAKGFSAYSFAGLSGAAGIINETSRNIAVTVPFGTNRADLVATFTTTGTGVKVQTLEQTSGISVNDFSTPVIYTVSAADNTVATYTVNVTIAVNPAKGFSSFSFVGFTGFAGTVNEPAKTIAVNLPFGTSAANLIASFTSSGTGVKVSDVLQTSGVTAHNFTAPVAYTVTAADNTTETYIVTVTIATNPAKSITSFLFAGFTGAAGAINETAKIIMVTVPFGTNVTNLVATFTTTGPAVHVGTTVQTSSATANNFSTPVAYTVTAADGSTSVYTVNVLSAPNPAKSITSFSFVGFTGFAGTVNETAKSIAVTLPFGSNVTGLVAAFTTTGVGVKVGTTVQTSTAIANNFTSPVVYTVIADDTSTAAYTVTVTIAPNPAKAITSFSFVGFSGSGRTINELDRSIALVLPFGTDIKNLTASFITSGTIIKVGTTVQTSGTTPNDFTNPLLYIVSAADGTTQTYTVSVTLTAAGGAQVPLLGEAGRFVILASQLVSTTAGSLVSNGDIGVEDQARTFMTGFTPVGSNGAFVELTNGLSYASEDANPIPYPYPLHVATLPVGAAWTSTGAMITQAKTDLGIAYTFLNTFPNPGAPTQSCPTELGGQVLAPGVYYTAASVLLSTGALQLDAQGDPNAVWIFSIDGALTTGAPGGSISFVGGVGQAKNVYWRTGTSTTIGAGTTFYGNVFAWTEVKVLAGANVTGRLFAVTDQVTLISNNITKAP